MRAFNNVLQAGSNVDHADIAPASPRTCVGVDLGESAHFAMMRFYPRINNTNSNGAMLSGSNSSDWNVDGNFDNLTEAISGFVVGAGYWFERPSLDAGSTYRYLFCHNPSNNGWNGNVSELQLYGWFESDVAAAVQGVDDFAVACGTTLGVILTWTPVAYGTYTIERKTDGGDWQAVASGLPASTATWTDSNVTMGTLYTYRVTTVNGANEAFSVDCEVRPYIAGNGVGLHGVWSAGYTSTNVGESVVSVTTNAVIDFANVSVGGATENFFVRWTGKLIAPVAGITCSTPRQTTRSRSGLTAIPSSIASRWTARRRLRRAARWRSRLASMTS